MRDLKDVSTPELEAEIKRRREAVRTEENPMWVCPRCGAKVFYRGEWSGARFGIQMEAAKAQHQDCPLSNQGGGI